MFDLSNNLPTVWWLGGISLTKNKRITSIIITSIIFFTLFVSFHSSSAEDVLAITGPVEAFEGEEVEFTVTLNGEPVQARVTFLLASSTAIYSDATTGKVNFTMPSVPFEDLWCAVNAFIPADLSATHYILVKNATGLLNVTLPEQPVYELEEFNVKITHENASVSDASVWFGSSLFLSDANGNVTLTAPDVLVTTNYGIFVNKTGYKSTSSMIAIQEAGLGQQLMEVITPYIVEPGEENIKIKVIDLNGGLPNVTLEVYYEGEKRSERLTDNTGEAYLTAPTIRHNDYFTLYVSKEGYQTYDGESDIQIGLLARTSDNDLDIQPTSSEVYESDLIIIVVVDELGIPVEEATIWKETTELDDRTDVAGIVVFSAPLVFTDREFFIYAIKEGYNFAEEQIIIRDTGNGEKTLYINVDTTVTEKETFFLTIKDAENMPVQDATVVFNSEQKQTDGNGNVSFEAPEVTSDTFFSIEVTKYEYVPASTSIEVLQQASSNGQSSKQLQICVAPTILENEEFSVTIRNMENSTVSNAQVQFMDTVKITDYKGEATFLAPDVSWDENKDIRVTKSGYYTASSTIVVKNTSGFEYWYLLVIVAIILMVGIVAYLRYRQYMF